MVIACVYRYLLIYMSVCIARRWEDRLTQYLCSIDASLFLMQGKKRIRPWDHGYEEEDGLENSLVVCVY